MCFFLPINITVLCDRDWLHLQMWDHRYREPTVGSDIHGFWYLLWVLEPIPCGYQGTTRSVESWREKFTYTGISSGTLSSGPEADTFLAKREDHSRDCKEFAGQKGILTIPPACVEILQTARERSHHPLSRLVFSSPWIQVKKINRKPGYRRC